MAGLTTILDARPNATVVFQYQLSNPETGMTDFELDDDGIENVEGQFNSVKNIR